MEVSQLWPQKLLIPPGTGAIGYTCCVQTKSDHRGGDCSRSQIKIIFHGLGQVL